MEKSLNSVAAVPPITPTGYTFSGLYVAHPFLSNSVTLSRLSLEERGQELLEDLSQLKYKLFPMATPSLGFQSWLFHLLLGRCPSRGAPFLELPSPAKTHPLLLRLIVNSSLPQDGAFLEGTTLNSGFSKIYTAWNLEAFKIC